MNNFARGNWFLMFGLFVMGMAVLVMASVPNWSGSDVNYTIAEDAIYYHNLSANITGFNNDVTFSIDTDVDNKISWTNSTGAPVLVFPSEVAEWISITNSSTGNLTINAIYDNQTGFFVIPLQAINTTDDEGAITNFEFIVNATNDAPNFTSSGIVNNYTFAADSSLQSFILEASDEESHFPLIFSVSFNATNCTHGVGTGFSDNSDCDLSVFGLNVTHPSNTTANISFAPNSTFVGTFWANISVMDAAINYNCPHDFCDATYNTTNLTTYHSQIVKFTVSPTLKINASNCTGITLTEGDELNCTIVITTPGETDNLTLTSDASFRNVETVPHNASWFVLDNSSPIAANFNHNVTVFVASVDKKEVGNWTINFTVDNGVIEAVSTSILVYVNFTESNVILDSISDIQLYENFSFSVNATDGDLFVRDSSVKDEVLTFASNTSWVALGSQSNPALANYSTMTLDVDWDTALQEESTGNVSVMINVTDVVGNTHNQTFVIEIFNETAPEWNDTLSDPVSVVLTEDTAFSYNVSVNVTDAEGDAITLFYNNISAEFCSLNSTNFNSTSGIISFTPVDCDVGYHNVTIIASDGNLNSSQSFNFTVNNIADTPVINDLDYEGGSEITNGSNLSIVSGATGVFSLEVDDDDFLIPSGQRGNFYNESLTIDVVATNSTGGDVDLFELSFGGVSAIVGFDFRTIYNVSFTPEFSEVDNYTIFINITDLSGISINRTFILNITASTNAPNLTEISNQSLTFFDVLNFTVLASDVEDDFNEVNLSFDILNLTTASPNLTIGINNGSVIFDMESNTSYRGAWRYNVTVTDSSGQIDWQEIYVFVYGNATLVNPTSGTVFNLTENIASILNFTINHSVGDNLTYEFWIDSITCVFNDSSNCTYGNITLRETANSFGNGSAYNWSFTSNFTDETYGNLKNLTVQVFPNSTELNSTQRAAVATNFSFSLNISHTNHPPEVYNSFGAHSGTFGTTSPIEITLTDNFRDYDFLDSFYLQNVTFFVTSDKGVNSQLFSEGTAAENSLPWNGTVDLWTLELYALIALEEQVTIEANDSFDSATSDPFTVIFIEPSVTTVTVPSGGGGTKTKLKHFSLKLIAPQDIIISERGFIDIPFAIQNNGQVDLRGISLSSFVRFNDVFSDDVKISLGDNFIEELKLGQTENFTMRITANTQRAGKYKATIFANVTSPKFTDFADFFIEIRKANESEAEQILIFTDKFIAENPECLELTELLNLAEEAFSLGEYSNSIRLAREVTEACEDAIEANEQIRYKVEGFVQDNFYYISFATLVMFFMGFVFYIYKRVRFNKSGMDEYV